MKKVVEITIGNISKRTGIPISTIHYYEEKGLISSFRNKANHRRYTPDVVRKLSVIKVAQKTGIPLREIKEALNTIPDGEKVNKRHWQRLSNQWQEKLDRRIDQLTRLRDLMDGCIGCGCLSIEDCEMLNPEDRLAKEGAGARLLDLDK